MPPTVTGAAAEAARGEVCCAPVTSAQLDQEAAETLARIFKALGDPTRVRLLSLIAAANEREACVCELTDPVGLSQPRRGVDIWPPDSGRRPTARKTAPLA